MIVGTEWIIDAFGCEADSLRREDTLRAVFAQVIDDLGLKTLGDGNWHQFPDEQGVTGLVMLTESHLACHTYPEFGTATFNLYCCRERPEWDWEGKLKKVLGASSVRVTKFIRGNVESGAAERNAAERSAGVSPAVVEASRFHSLPKTTFSDVKKRDRGHLPHWEKENGIYFITFRLADSLPKNILDRFKFERDEAARVLEKLDRELSITEEKRIDALFSDKIEEYLDNGTGSCILRLPEIAKLVTDAIKYFEGDRYDTFAWCVMPNHVHAVLRPKNRHELEDILHSWKSYTAHEINKLTGGKGEVWQHEYYDHLVRDGEDLERVINYVLDNPIKAGLYNWEWVGGLEMKYRTA